MFILTIQHLKNRWITSSATELIVYMKLRDIDIIKSRNVSSASRGKCFSIRKLKGNREISFYSKCYWKLFFSCFSRESVFWRSFEAILEMAGNGLYGDCIFSEKLKNTRIFGRKIDTLEMFSIKVLIENLWLLKMKNCKKLLAFHLRDCSKKKFLGQSSILYDVL